MKLLETLAGDGEVRHERGAKVCGCSYLLGVFGEEVPAHHLRGGGSAQGMKQVQILELVLDAALPVLVNLELVIADGRRLPFIVQGTGEFRSHGLVP